MALGPTFSPTFGPAFCKDIKANSDDSNYRDADAKAEGNANGGPSILRVFPEKGDIGLLESD